MANEAPWSRLGHRREHGTSGFSFVFVNPLTGNAATWEQTIAPELRRLGHGTLTFDLPGQAGSPFIGDRTLGARDLTAATAGIVRSLAPSRPVFVGHSIGGLFALQAHLDEGVPASGFVLINTLRKADARLAWINDAVARLAALGGGRLLRDVYGPLLFGPAALARMREGALGTEPYEGLAAEAADRQLLAAGCGADWHVRYEDVRAPVVVLTGLQDRVFYDEAAVAELAARLPDAVRQDVADGGHMLPVEAPDAVIRACVSIIDRIGSG